jgi:hypothetical protein
MAALLKCLRGGWRPCERQSGMSELLWGRHCHVGNQNVNRWRHHAVKCLFNSGKINCHNRKVCTLLKDTIWKITDAWKSYLLKGNFLARGCGNAGRWYKLPSWISFTQNGCQQSMNIHLFQLTRTAKPHNCCQLHQSSSRVWSLYKKLIDLHFFNISS